MAVTGICQGPAFPGQRDARPWSVTFHYRKPRCQYAQKYWHSSGAPGRLPAGFPRRSRSTWPLADIRDFHRGNWPGTRRSFLDLDPPDDALKKPFAAYAERKRRKRSWDVVCVLNSGRAGDVSRDRPPALVSMRPRFCACYAALGTGRQVIWRKNHAGIKRVGLPMPGLKNAAALRYCSTCATQFPEERALRCGIFRRIRPHIMSFFRRCKSMFFLCRQKRCAMMAFFLFVWGPFSPATADSIRPAMPPLIGTLREAGTPDMGIRDLERLDELAVDSTDSGGGRPVRHAG